jgi:hypothetical protein
MTDWRERSASKGGVVGLAVEGLDVGDEVAVVRPLGFASGHRTLPEPIEWAADAAREFPGLAFVRPVVRLQTMGLAEVGNSEIG